MDTAIRSGCTCITCRLVFASVELQRQHYSSEWHRYNVKRQIAELPPITEEQFEAKIKAHQETEAENDKKKRRTKKQKKQQTANASNSDEDQEMEEGSGDVEDEEDGDYDEDDAIPSTECLFCSATSTSFDDNLLHMSKKHGFFIPDSNYCCDVEGLINYLGLKIGAGNYCIQCPNKRFRDLSSCQLHMRDKSHCQFSVEGDRVVEYLDYYDYGELLQEGDGEDGDDAAINLGFSLVLPSGTTLGHRALMRYYKQRLPSTEDQPEKLSKSARRLQQNQIKALGWTGTSGPLAVQRARDFKFMQNVMKKDKFRRELHGNKLFKSRGRDDQM